MTVSSSSTGPSITKLVEANLPPSSMNTDTVTSTPQSCSLGVLNSAPTNQHPLIAQTKPAIVSTAAPAVKDHPSVAISTSASSVENLDMGEQRVLKAHQFLRLKPKFLRYNCWDISGEHALRVVDWSFNFNLAKAIPAAPYLPPDHPVRKTVETHPELFKIITPINVEAFQDYVYIHENYLFVESVLNGLKNGFWPWADIDKAGYPLINDESRPPPKDLAKAQFLRNQRDEEVQKGRFSRAFGRDLFPGMYAMPSFCGSQTQLSQVPISD